MNKAQMMSNLPPPPADPANTDIALLIGLSAVLAAFSCFMIYLLVTQNTR